jgi:hypothetical protein
MTPSSVSEVLDLILGASTSVFTAAVRGCTHLLQVVVGIDRLRGLVVSAPG